MKKIIVENIVKTMELEGVIKQFDKLLMKFSHKCVKDLAGYHNNYNVFEDYYQMGLMDLVNVYDKYDYRKGISFFAYLSSSLNNRFLMIMREMEADIRKVSSSYVYLDQMGCDDCEISNVVGDEVDEYFEESLRLEQFIKTKLTEEELAMVSMQLKKDKASVSSSMKDCMEYAIDTMNTGKYYGCSSKVELAEALKISRPTLNTRTKQAMLKIRDVINTYLIEESLGA